MDVGFEPIDWVYSQSLGHLYLCDSQDVRTLVGTGYSGSVGHQNRSESEQLKSRGPIPRGVWRIGSKFNHARLGPASIPLTPVEESKAFGRSDFWIHGDNSRGDRSASRGCIILDRKTREVIDCLRSGAGIRTLTVID